MKVVCVGDCGVDRYIPLALDRPGGITLNFAAHARRLFAPGDSITVVSAIGNDPESRLVREALAALAIETELAELEGGTSLQLIDLEPSGEKIFVAYHQGVLENFRVGASERSLIAGSDLLMAPHYRQIDAFFESVAATPSAGLRAVDFADIAESPNTETVERYAGAFDIAFFGLTPEHAALIDALELVALREGKLFIVTLGPSGSLALSSRGRISVPATPVSKVVDTTGAGDTFAAGFLSQYCLGRDIESSLRRGADEAARTVARVGAF